MYSTYIRQFDNNVALLDEQCRKNTALAAVVREFEVTFIPLFLFYFTYFSFNSHQIPTLTAFFPPLLAQMSPRCASLALKHYLLKPVQRIPQYQLLLTGTNTLQLPISVLQGKTLLQNIIPAMTLSVLCLHI